MFAMKPNYPLKKEDILRWQKKISYFAIEVYLTWQSKYIFFFGGGYGRLWRFYKYNKV